MRLSLSLLLERLRTYPNADLHIQSNMITDVGALALAEAVASPHSRMEKFCESAARLEPLALDNR